MINRERCFSKKEIMKNPNKFALRFSEGNKSLEDLLNYCYSNNIMTRACCIGHENDSILYPQSYITFEINEQQFDMFANVSEIILNSKIGDKISIELSKNENILILNYFILDEVNLRNIFFKLLKNSMILCSGQICNNEYKDVFEIFQKMINASDRENNIELLITDKETTLNFYKEKYVEELDGVLNFKLSNEKDSTKLLNYLESLNNLDEFNMKNINNSFSLSKNDIEYIKNLQILNSYKKR
ncbi:MAG: hypothetical protein IJO32_02090 [Bacilli bacterium]|nr:hypothetical protein [Bacilli bacterium]